MGQAEVIGCVYSSVYRYKNYKEPFSLPSVKGFFDGINKHKNITFKKKTKRDE